MKYFWYDDIISQVCCLIVGYFIFLHFFVIVLGILKKVVQPSLVEGTISIGKNKEFVSWALNSVFCGIFLTAPMSKQISFIFYLNWIYYRLMGMKVSLSTMIGMNVTIRQPELIELGDGVIVGLGSIMSCHYKPSKTKHVQRKIIIKERSVLGGFAVLSPGVIVGHDSVIGARSVIYEGVRVGNNVRIGPECRVTFYSRIPDNVTIKAGTVITRNNKIKAGETWSGNPAVKVT
jgi:acetyltransferase-like isoleucine patch superfamily enzyme